jgi:Fic family protein
MENLKKQETEYGFKVSLENFLNSDIQTRDDFILKEAVYQSNLIEGITIDWCETISANSSFTLAHELSDHFKSYIYVLKNFSRILEEQDILKLHEFLMKNLFLKKAKEIINVKKLSIKKAEKVKRYFENAHGKYRKCKVWVGPSEGIFHGCLYYKQIPKAIKNLEKNMLLISSEKERNKKEDLIWDLHYEFETIHPFIDGNGRVGRLLLNWLSLHYLKEFFIVLNKNKMQYYTKINEYSKNYRKTNQKMNFYKDILQKNKKEYDSVSIINLCCQLSKK